MKINEISNVGNVALLRDKKHSQRETQPIFSKDETIAIVKQVIQQSETALSNDEWNAKPKSETQPKTDQLLHDAIAPILSEYSTKRFLEQAAIVLREMADEIHSNDNEGSFIYRADADDIETLSEHVKW